MQYHELARGQTYITYAMRPESTGLRRLIHTLYTTLTRRAA